MQNRMLGQSGMIVSKIALGTMTFGNETEEAEAFKILDTFVEKGGILVDTSNVYVGGTSEKIIGKWFADRPADLTQHVVLASKGRYNVAPDVNAQGLSRRALHRDLDESLGRLGLETLDLYQLHAADMRTPVEVTLSFLRDAIQAGKIHSYGLSNVTGWQLQLFASTAKQMGMELPVSLQPQYNLLSREIEYELVEAAQYNGLGILPWSPLAGGILTGKYQRGSQPPQGTRAAQGVDLHEWSTAEYLDSERAWTIVETLTDIAKKIGAAPAQVALSWLADRPGITAPICGARTLEQLESNLAAGDLALDPEDTEKLEKLSRPVPASTYPYGAFGVSQRVRYLNDPKQAVMDVTAGGSDDPLGGKLQ